MSATEHPEFPVLVVDDEPNIVNALRRELATPPLGRYRYAVEGFTDPAQALERARQKSFAAVISDYRMPEMDGVRLLEAFAEKQPDCARILLSGVAGMDDVIAAIDLAHIHGYLAKPWVDFELRAAVAQALAQRQLTIENRVLASMCRARNLGYAEG